MKEFKLIFLLTTACLTLSCNLDVNTSDPQASNSIQASLKDGFFISRAKKISAGSEDIVDSVWMEKVWFNKIRNGERVKVTFGQNQIVVSLKKNSKYNLDTYMIDWKISEESHGFFGSGNGVLILHCPKNDTITEITLKLDRMNRVQESCGRFLNM